MGKYVRRSSYWEAVGQLDEARANVFGLWALAERVLPGPLRAYRPCRRWSEDGTWHRQVPDVQYPCLGLIKVGPRCMGVHERLPDMPVLPCRTPWAPSPCGRLSRPRTTRGPPSCPRLFSRRRALPLPTWCGKWNANKRVGLNRDLCLYRDLFSTGNRPFLVAAAVSNSGGTPFASARTRHVRFGGTSRRLRACNGILVCAGAGEKCPQEVT
jgi:hypothetical protein